MVLMTKNRKLVELIRRAYERAQVRDDQVLVVWNARIYLNESLVVMESACPIFLDKIIDQLRIFTGAENGALSEFLWVRPVGNRARRWSLARRRSTPEGQPPVPSGDLR